MLGPNGSGKSTLIRTACNIDRPTSGRILIDGEDIASMDIEELAKIISYVPQAGQYAEYDTVLDTVLVGRSPHMGWEPTENDLDIVQRSMEYMGVLDLADQYINELSGGQRQRVFIARSIAQEPQLFVFDEPTNSLDLKFFFSDETSENMVLSPSMQKKERNLCRNLLRLYLGKLLSTNGILLWYSHLPKKTVIYGLSVINGMIQDVSTLRLQEFLAYLAVGSEPEYGLTGMDFNSGKLTSIHKVYTEEELAEWERAEREASDGDGSMIPGLRKEDAKEVCNREKTENENDTGRKWGRIIQFPKEG